MDLNTQLLTCFHCWTYSMMYFSGADEQGQQQRLRPSVLRQNTAPTAGPTLPCM